MDEKDQSLCTLQDLYATSAPIFANGEMHLFGIFQCTTGVSMLLVAPADADEVPCPLCGKKHRLRDSFIRMTVDEFVSRYQVMRFQDRGQD
ncbi:hypothetical protein [Leptolinea tardivitalis]|uniref:Uncharacterized protein n=1 Tax=Leptolinea tardivitalis TaxID=229920 RepID=A0A0P6WUR8_9CHLR|nr:hypothetical protein [Leptolinea tardivitalis]KPL74001.1 hypothetical protein ADM99_01820 [Leptolinea tardivitalis]GAP22634.1 hypothetical protein LTAR_02873 [Leptolinea tardivitalis]